MTTRRIFITGLATGIAGIAVGRISDKFGKNENNVTTNHNTPAVDIKGKPIVISTWDHGMPANVAAAEILEKGGRALDAVEAGVRVPEADPNVMTVGYGGFPDRDGFVTLDACIMNEKGEAGSVTFLQHIKHPISVARMVMEKTPHVMLSGDGALQFALANGFVKEDLFTEKARKAWEEWKIKSEYKPIINIENHDTISMLAIDKNGDISGACTTSGMAFKMHGRVGDSPIIGAGMFCDNEVGGAAATGQGELVMKTLGSFLVVELMLNGMSPKEACKEAVLRIVRKIPDYEKSQIGYIAINKAGEVGAYCLHPGFNYALYRDGENKLIDAESYIKNKA
jgi:isoaspartyl peptidase/L-asparaginase-like protein (Ntn-hydrolase superfamily)